MYKSFEANNFRCFKKLVVDNLTRINLVTGLNNVGKTALLEAFFVHSGLYNPSLVFTIDLYRGIEKRKIELGGRWFYPPWNYIFNDFNIAQTIEFVGIYDDSKKRKLCLRAVQDSKELTGIYKRFVHSPAEENDLSTSVGLSTDAHVLEFHSIDDQQSFKYYFMYDRKGSRAFPIPPALPYQVVFAHSGSRFTDIDIERFGKIQRNKKENVILKALKWIEPRLKSLSVVLENDQNFLEGDVGMSRLVPLPLMGEGLVRLAILTLAIAEAENGVVLIDEIENGFHYSVLPRVWRVINEASRLFNTQIIATTHSFECISAAHKTFGRNQPYDFSLHRLERSGEVTRSVDFTRESLSVAIASSFEVR